MIKPMNFPVISIVVPMYNVESYIGDCIQSILKQTFQQFEIICVNDGCTDNTLAVLSQFEDNRIRVVSQKNQGLSAARNTGINLCRGLYIALLDSDDFWAPEKLITHYQHLSQNINIGVSYSASLFVDEAGQEIGIGQHPQINNINPETILCRNPVGNGSAAVIRASLFRDVAHVRWIGGERRRCYFDENMRQSEDVEFWLRVALTTDWVFSGIEKPLNYYRVNNQGLSANVENQLSAWQYGINKNRAGNEAFFKRWYPLAKAYQLRYLARRAIHSGEGISALKLVNQALLSSSVMLIQEPGRTALTYLCALLSLLPRKAYHALETAAIRVGLKQESTA